MKKYHVAKSLLLLLTLTVLGLNCADVPSSAPELPEMLANFRFFNAAVDVNDSINITMDSTASIGSIAYKAATDYADIIAGSRMFVLSTSDTLRVPMGSYRKGTVIILPVEAGSNFRSHLRLYDRRTFDPVELDTGVVRIANAALSQSSLDVTIMNADTSVSITNTMIMGETTGYLPLPVGTYTVTTIATGDAAGTILATTSLPITNRRQTSVIVGDQTSGSLEIVKLQDD